jgi:hypothetical protein
MAKKARSSKAVRTTSAAKAAAKKPAATKAAPKKPAIKAAKKAAAKKTASKKPAASLAVLTTAQMEKVSSHFEAHLGKAEWVLHEHESRKIHIDINEFQPSKKVPHTCLATMGMSALPMHVPKGMPIPARAELCIFLPKKWQVDPDAWEKSGEDAFWPIRWLQAVARLPFEQRTYLAVGHSVPSANPPEAIAPKCKFVGFLIGPSFIEPLSEFKLGREKVSVLTLMPLFAGEMQLVVEEGPDAIIDLFEEAGIDPMDIADPARRDVTARKKSSRRKS